MKKKRRITVASAKAKGRNLQITTCKMLSDITKIPYGSDDDSLISSRPMGQHGVDVILRGEAAELIKLAIECKSSEQWNIPKAIKQVRTNQKKGTDWIIVLKKKEFKTPFILLEMKAFAKIYKSHIKLLKRKKSNVRH